MDWLFCNNYYEVQKLFSLFYKLVMTLINDNI